MANNHSVVWDVAALDANDSTIAWCTIQSRDECKNPIKRGGKKARNYSTSTVKRHFEKYHPVLCSLEYYIILIYFCNWK